jgi:homocitrate synthase NifV
MHNALLIDTTLRDGAQTPHITLGLAHRVHIARMLADLGITEIEAGIPAMGRGEQEAIRAVVKEVGTKCHISVWCRAVRADLFHGGGCGADTVHITFPMSDGHLRVIGQTERWLFESLEHLIEAGHANFDRVTVGCQDASRAPLDRLTTFVKMAMAAGAARVRLADTVGILTPLGTQELLTHIRNSVKNAALDFHGHNDLGMATANAVTALSLGAAAVSVTLGGIGERAGNAALEEVVMGISQAEPELELGIKKELLAPVCREFAAMIRRKIPPQKPITGMSVFTHESGIHCDGLRKNPLSFEPFIAQKTGHAPSTFVGGTHSGSAAIRWILREQGIEISREKARELCETVREEALQKGRSLLPHEIKRLHNNRIRAKSASSLSF